MTSHATEHTRTSSNKQWCTGIYITLWNNNLNNWTESPTSSDRLQSKHVNCCFMSTLSWPLAGKVCGLDDVRCHTVFAAWQCEQVHLPLDGRLWLVPRASCFSVDDIVHPALDLRLGGSFSEQSTSGALGELANTPWYSGTRTGQPSIELASTSIRTSPSWNFPGAESDQTEAITDGWESKEAGSAHRSDSLVIGLPLIMDSTQQSMVTKPSSSKVDVRRWSWEWSGLYEFAFPKHHPPRFADDIDGLAGSELELANLVERLDKTSTAYGMQISAEKTKLMTMNTDGISSNIRVNGEKLETVQSFNYLGAIVTDERSMPEIRSRIAQTIAALTKLKIIWDDKNIDLSSKIRCCAPWSCPYLYILVRLVH